MSDGTPGSFGGDGSPRDTAECALSGLAMAEAALANDEEGIRALLGTVPYLDLISGLTYLLTSTVSALGDVQRVQTAEVTSRIRTELLSVLAVSDPA